LLGKRGRESLADQLAQGRRASRASMMELAIKGGHHPARVIAGKRREDG
jgi:hypothetical protein